MLGVSKQTRINVRDVWIFIFKWTERRNDPKISRWHPYLLH